MYVGMSEAIQSPQYNPLDPDITLKASLAELETQAERDSLRYIAQDYTQRKSINFSNVRKGQNMMLVIKRQSCILQKISQLLTLITKPCRAMYMLKNAQLSTLRRQSIIIILLSQKILSPLVK